MITITKQHIEDLPIITGQLANFAEAPPGKKPWIRMHRMVGTRMPQYQWDEVINKALLISKGKKAPKHHLPW